MPKYSSKIGDIYSVPLDGKTKRYFQYVASDMTQLNSSVIKVFKSKYPLDEKPNLNYIINDEVDFYAHTVIQWGVKANTWGKVGNVSEVVEIDAFFRQSDDHGRKSGEPRVEISYKWRVWKINEPMKFVGKLEGENKKAEIGSVMPAYQILERMRTGKYNFTYPGYDENSIMTYIPFEEGERVRKLLEKAMEEKMKKIESRKTKKKDG